MALKVGFKLHHFEGFCAAGETIPVVHAGENGSGRGPDAGRTIASKETDRARAVQLLTVFCGQCDFVAPALQHLSILPFGSTCGSAVPHVAM
eukprot:gene3328-biopygen14274